jgi:PAS domain S-box-containing protein
LSKVESVVSNSSAGKQGRPPQELEINLWGNTHYVTVDVERSLSFLASTYENAIQINHQLNREIAERKRVEQQLRITVERLKQMESIIEISPAVAFVRRAEANWPVEFVSDNVLQFDYESEDLVSGRITYSDIVHPDDRQRVFEEVAQYSRDKNIEEFSQEYRIVTGYGDDRWVDDRTFVRRNSKGVATHYQGIILDVTDRKKAI